MDKYSTLKQLILSGDTFVVPDAYDGVSAKLIQRAGFKAIQCSGHSISLTKAYQEERLLSADENVSRTKEITDAVHVPVMADAEDGYGHGGVFRSNLLKFIRTGIAGINIEDQNLWDPYETERIVPAKVMLDKIGMVLQTKKELGVPDFVLNARTDALGTSESSEKGLRTAIERANCYLEAGAEMAFIPYVRTKDEIRLLKQEIAGPISIAAGLPYNIGEFTINDCRELGVTRVSLPTILIYTTMKSVQDTLTAIEKTGTFDWIQKNDRLFDAEKLSEVFSS